MLKEKKIHIGFYLQYQVIQNQRVNLVQTPLQYYEKRISEKPPLFIYGFMIISMVHLHLCFPSHFQL